MATEITTLELLREAGKRKYRMVFLSLLFAAGTFYFCRIHLFLYEAQTTVTWLDPSVVDARILEDQSTSPLRSEFYNRLYSTVHSNAMYRHLITKFGLLKHYGIDTTREFYEERAIAILKNRIKLVKTPFNLIAISVEDAYRYRCAEIANEAAAYADILNRKTTVSALQKRLRINEEMIRQLRAEHDMQALKLQHSLDRMVQLSDHSSALERSREELAQSVYSLRSSTDQLVKAGKYYRLLEASLLDQNLPSIITVESAKASAVSLNRKAGILGILAGLACFSVMLGITYLRLRYQHLAKAYLRG